MPDTIRLPAFQVLLTARAKPFWPSSKRCSNAVMEGGGRSKLEPVTCYHTFSTRRGRRVSERASDGFTVKQYARERLVGLVRSEKIGCTLPVSVAEIGKNKKTPMASQGGVERGKGGLRDSIEGRSKVRLLCRSSGSRKCLGENETRKGGCVVEKDERRLRSVWFRFCNKVCRT